MYEGKPLVLVVGSTDTGRTPIAAALLRKALGPQVIVQTAGVLSHAGEAATPEAQLAVEQIGLDISRHVSRPLHHEEHGQAELLLAVDRGTELVLATEFPNDPRVACLSALAELPDVLDPHRMPLGVWIAVMRQINDHVRGALVQIRQRLGISSAEPLPDSARTIERHLPAELLAASAVARRADWGTEEEMQRLMGLINAPTSPADPAAELQNGAVLAATETVPAAADLAAETAIIVPGAADPSSTPGRAEQVERMARMLAVAAELPEIIDWLRLRQTLVEQLRVVTQHSAGPLDFAPAAVLMIEGKLAQHTSLPHSDGLALLRASVLRLVEPLAADGLAAIGSDLAQW